MRLSTATSHISESVHRHGTKHMDSNPCVDSVFYPRRFTEHGTPTPLGKTTVEIGPPVQQGLAVPHGDDAPSQSHCSQAIGKLSKLGAIHERSHGGRASLAREADREPHSLRACG